MSCVLSLRFSIVIVNDLVIVDRQDIIVVVSVFVYHFTYGTDRHGSFFVIFAIEVSRVMDLVIVAFRLESK